MHPHSSTEAQRMYPSAEQADQALQIEILQLFGVCLRAVSIQASLIWLVLWQEPLMGEHLISSCEFLYVSKHAMGP